MIFKFYKPKILSKFPELLKEINRIFGLYSNNGKVTLYIFGDCEDIVERVIEHESLHYIIDRLEGDKISTKYDNIYDGVEERE